MTAQARTLRHLRSPGTFETTKFPTWWKKLNGLLVKNGLPEYGFSEAHNAYEVGQSPETELAEALARQS